MQFPNPPSVKLFQARPLVDPALFFQELAVKSAELGVTKQDINGDFNLTPETSSLRQFEAEVATYLGKEDALFVPSGIMAQNIVLAIAKKQSKLSRFICHWSSHFLIHEHNAYEELLNMTADVIAPEELFEVQSPVSFHNVSQFIQPVTLTLTAPSSSHAVMILECPHREIGGKCTSIADIQQISSLCRSSNVHFHMDGARLWEALAHYTPTTDMHTFTGYFNSIYVSFYKGLGGIDGSMLLGSKAFIAEARVWMRRFGGNVFTHIPYYISCWAGFCANKDAFEQRKIRLQEVVAAVQEAMTKEFEDCDDLIRLDPPIPQVSMIHVYLGVSKEQGMQLLAQAEAKCGVRCVGEVRPGRYGAADQSYSEFNMVRMIDLLHY